ATPMFSVFTSKPDLTAYTARPNQVPLDEMNPKLAGLSGLQRPLARFSVPTDRSEPDSADADLLNRAIWHSVKGFDTPYNYGRPVLQQHPSFEALLRIAGRSPAGGRLRKRPPWTRRRSKPPACARVTATAMRSAAWISSSGRV